MSIELGEIEVTEEQILSSESSLARPLSPINWEAVGNISRTDDKVQVRTLVIYVIGMPGDQGFKSPGPPNFYDQSCVMCAMTLFYALL